MGDTVDVHCRILEGEKERIQIFNGLVIARAGSGTRETFTVRRIVQGEGVERKFPLHSPRIAKIEVKRSGITRRAKLYYLRDRTGKAVRLKERRIERREVAGVGELTLASTTLRVGTSALDAPRPFADQFDAKRRGPARSQRGAWEQGVHRHEPPANRFPLAERLFPKKTLGQRGEAAAARFLRRRGYKVLARGDRFGPGELDLVMLDGETIVFVEVKTGSPTMPAIPRKPSTSKNSAG